MIHEFFIDHAPIIACSTGTHSNTAVALIRLSGFNDLKILQPFFSLKLDSVKPRHSHLTNICHNSKVFDQVLLTFFPEGASYTGENVLELSVHGNQLNISNILQLFIDRGGFRLAGAGEFSYRALKNKKLSLSQVEGLDLLLNANSPLMLSQGLDILQGELHHKYLDLYQSFLKVKAAVELSIDFSEDVGEQESRNLFNDSFKSFLSKIESLHHRTQGNISSLLSPEVALVGQTNAGKSSLFNLLLKDNRSIVSNIPGTTRDFISELFQIDGIHFRLIDTAGVRESSDVIEQIGIDRALSILDRSFFKILIINPHETTQSYLAKFSSIDFDIILFSHWDQPQFWQKLLSLDLSALKSKYFLNCNFLDGSIGPVDDLLFGPMGPQKLSGSREPLLGAGPIEPQLRSWILLKYQALTLNNPILLERHRLVINKTYLRAQALSSHINHIDDVAILSSEVNLFSRDLSELLGIVSADDVLNSIFANFCIGK